MTSNELNEILNKTRRTKEISLSVEQVEEIVNKLEVLEILKEHTNIPKTKRNEGIVIVISDLNNNFYKVKRWLNGNINQR